jgi:ribosomal peptide maturation radical SAM protein 1
VIDPDFPLEDGDALLVVPPFFDVTKPSLAAHVLQASAGAEGFHVPVLYANILLAAELGVDAYTQVGFPKQYPPHALAGERFFAQAAHDLPAMGWNRAHMMDLAHAYGLSWASYMRVSRLGKPETLQLSLLALLGLVERVPGWLDAVTGLIADRRFLIVGCSSTFNETNASFALCRCLKARDPEIITVIGGANCEGELAKGMVSLDPDGCIIDHVFSGDGEAAFPRFLGRVARGEPPSARIIRGDLCTDLDGLPTPDYGEYIEQRDFVLPELARSDGPAELPYETSRGCWWGERQQCTFCGTNGDGVQYRHKSAQRVIDDLQQIARRYPNCCVHMADTVMPQAYFRTLLPQLAERRLPLSLGYGQRANLGLNEVITLARAGVDLIQPGIEALSTRLLHRMRKGTSARDNIALLRYARATGLRLLWALLWGFPGDEREEYEETLALLPLLHHLQAPGSLLHVSVDRFSPYFDDPDAFGVHNIRPLCGYADVFPPQADVFRLAHYFTADYECASHRHLGLVEQIASEVEAWQGDWLSAESRPVLHITRTGGGRFILFDTRGLPGTQVVQILTDDRARAALVAQPALEAEEFNWGLDQKVGVMLDGWYVPLATADPELILKFEQEIVAVGDREQI